VVFLLPPVDGSWASLEAAILLKPFAKVFFALSKSDKLFATS
jgi:hypothetical protein